MDGMEIEGVNVKFLEPMLGVSIGEMEQSKVSALAKVLTSAGVGRLDVEGVSYIPNGIGLWLLPGEIILLAVEHEMFEPTGMFANVYQNIGLAGQGLKALHRLLGEALVPSDLVKAFEQASQNGKLRVVMATQRGINFEGLTSLAGAIEFLTQQPFAEELNWSAFEVKMRELGASPLGSDVLGMYSVSSEHALFEGCWHYKGIAVYAAMSSKMDVPGVAIVGSGLDDFLALLQRLKNETNGEVPSDTVMASMVKLRSTS